MNDLVSKSLLPAGLQDLLPPEAAQESLLSSELLNEIYSHGYLRVKPPFLEFENSLLSDTGAALSEYTFRLMDPVSRRMMAFRSDMTPQVGRIARTRLAHAERPLRLCYGGDILRVQGSELRPERQFAQVGLELIGTESANADVEILLLAVDALTKLGIEELTVDLSAPTLTTSLIKELELPTEICESLREALDLKDMKAVSTIGGDSVKPLIGLLKATGPVQNTLGILSELDLPVNAKKVANTLYEIASLATKANPKLRLTIDPVEHRGFEYQTGISFAFFASNVRGELGRGGRYEIAVDSAQIEQAVGCTLYMDTLLRALPSKETKHRIFIPFDISPTVAKGLRDQGWITISALEPNTNNVKEAHRLGCSHIASEAGAVEIRAKE